MSLGATRGEGTSLIGPPRIRVGWSSSRWANSARGARRQLPLRLVGAFGSGGSTG